MRPPGRRRGRQAQGAPPSGAGGPGAHPGARQALRRRRPVTAAGTEADATPGQALWPRGPPAGGPPTDAAAGQAGRPRRPALPGGAAWWGLRAGAVAARGPAADAAVGWRIAPDAPLASPGTEHRRSPRGEANRAALGWRFSDGGVGDRLQGRESWAACVLGGVPSLPGCAGDRDRWVSAALSGGGVGDRPHGRESWTACVLGRVPSFQ
eukprot:CAMPEP_0204346154 /NCGR_PEP_ID=MMETSP0469-20131031/26966_1 /ASSEMBLY_ACC=CAM_ASM_000384 /TAXON_ID=2969 /ORGANISM="Oxyrrhis marina" /LENGTH=208 /DNA_ID=CAMNT_0051331725 /DNA_START=554 /DNA_END=1178 /DNA_ORIENTATION=+